jgi:hypothetical protein
MILKLRTLDDGWVYYDITRKIKVRDLTKEQYQNGCNLNSPNRVEVELPVDDVRPLHQYTGDLKVITFEEVNNNIGDYVIYTNLTAYLLNDNGKTIEKLN